MMSIYFVQDTGSRAIKCGSAADVGKRISALQTANPSPLKVVATFACSRKYKGYLHQLLEPFRIRGEWFRPGPWLDNVIEAFEQGADVDYLMEMLQRERQFFGSAF